MQLTQKDFISELSRVFAKNSLGSLLNAEKSEKLFRLTERMLTENEKYNLTAITEPKKIILNHYADCATLAARLPRGARIIDVGCGAGFPTLPLAVLREDVRILALDSTAKRIEYVKGSAELVGLENVETIAARAEDAARLAQYREAFDYATARAVAQMRILAELCLPFVKVGGYMLAMKGKNAEFELADAKRAIAILGGRDVKVENVSLISDEETLSHPIITVAKKVKTPDAYPRPFAKISKKPL